MNLQALYDLKERLEFAAIAGTGLMQEDFRLHRAVEALAPLAKANPVFGKIFTGARALLTAPEQERGVRLLDVLSLVDAVVYTQGVTSAAGEMTPAEPGFGSCVSIPYSQLHPLIQALSGTGTGRTAQIREFWQEHPDYFRDFRVLPHVVGALKDPYSELADLIGQILSAQGEGIIPLLKEGFDPAGKADMVRRVRLVAKLGGERENEWFAAQLAESKKDVREAIIQALGLCQNNAALLRDLCQSERGKLKDAALRSLAMMEDEACVAFLQKEANKHPDSVLCLRGVESTTAADLTADVVGQYLTELLENGHVYDQTELTRLLKITALLVGKYSEKLRALWVWVGANMERFAGIVPEKNVRACDMSVGEHLQKSWLMTILACSDSGIQNLAKELGARNPEWFLGGAMVADMALMSAGALYEKYAPHIVRTGLLRREKESDLRRRVQIMQALFCIRWNPDLRAYCTVFCRYDRVTGAPVTSARRLDGVDPRWVKLFTAPEVCRHSAVFSLSTVDYHVKADPAIDELISSLVNPEDPQVCTAAGQWFYARLMESGNLNHYFAKLRRCGWMKWDGVLEHCARKRGEISFNLVMSVLRDLPVSNLEKADQLRKLDTLAQEKKLKIRNNLWPREMILRQIALLEADPNAQL